MYDWKGHALISGRIATSDQREYHVFHLIGQVLEPILNCFNLGDLDSYRCGPTVIKERVRAVGGNMVIESTPGHGSRLEITIPKEGFESYGY